MDLWIHNLLNVLLPLMVAIPIVLFSPFLLIFKFASFTKRSIHKENVADKVVLITGSSSGIGEHVAYEYAKKGACLSLVDIRNDRLLAVAEKARNIGSPDVLVICADVSKFEDCRKFVDKTVNHFGRLDHLVSNAGITHAQLFGETTDFSDDKRLMDINFWGSVYCAHFAAPHLKKTKGKIIVTSSVLASITYPKVHFYSASKAALNSFFQTLRLEFGSDIHIIIVAPGMIKTEMTTTDNIVSQARLDFYPMEAVEACASGIVEKAWGGADYIIEPSWTRGLLWIHYFYYDIYTWLVHWFFIKFCFIPNKFDSMKATR